MAGDRPAIPAPAAQSVRGRMRVSRTYGPGHYMLRFDSLRHRWRKSCCCRLIFLDRLPQIASALLGVPRNPRPVRFTPPGL